MRTRTQLLLLPIIALGCAPGCRSGDENAQPASLPVAAPVETPAEASAAAPGEPRRYRPEEMPRLTPAEVQPLVQNGEALLVCAYDNDEKFENARLAGAISLRALEQQLPALAKDRLLVFYCA